MEPLAYSPEQFTAFWSAVTGIAAVVTGLVAIFTLLALRSDSRDRTRPVVSADLLPVTLSHGTSELVIQNVGPSVAKEVQVTFDPNITEDIGQMAAYIARRYSKVIPTMGPGRRLTNVYGHWVGDSSDKLDEPVPKDLTVSISYKDTHGRRYTDSYELSVGTLRNQTTTSPSNTDDAGMKRRWVTALEAIARGIGRQ